MEIKTEPVEYKDNGTVLEGYLAYSRKLKERRPGVLIVHEWTGLGPFAMGRAEELARLGYVAFAVDIYGKGIRPANAQEASAQANLYRSNRRLMRQRAQAGLNVLKNTGLVDPAQIAVIGYCFGGTAALELARSGAEIKGAVSFHGGLNTPHPEDAKNIKAKVLILHGADDPHVPANEVLQFQQEMRQADVDWQMISYGGAVHSFTNPKAGNDPSTGSAYNQIAAQRSWQAMQQFFREIFEKSPRD